MPDFIGNIEVPEIAVSGVFPIVTEFPHGRVEAPQVVVHRFGSGNAKVEQRFLLGTSAKRFVVQRSFLNKDHRIALRDFWEARQGPYGAFYYDAPNDNGLGTTRYTVRFADEPLSWQMLSDWVCSTGVTLIEIPSSAPNYSLNETLERFPSSALAAALLDQAQEIIPLIVIVPKTPVGDVSVASISGVRIPGNAVPWETSGGKNAGYPFLDPVDTNAGPTVVAATGLVAGQDITLSPVDGGVAWDNIGFGTYLWAPPEGLLEDGYTESDWHDLYNTGIHDGATYPSYYTATHGGLGYAGLVGAFTDDDGNVVRVIAVGTGGKFRVPPGASKLQLGINRINYISWDAGTGGASSHFDYSSATITLVENTSYPAIYLSDRRVTVGGQLYQARLLKFDGIQQSAGGESDEARFVFGNADRVMRDLANDVDLYRASIQFSLFHVGTGIKLDLWKGEIIDWTLDQGPEFQVSAADGLYELRLPYPTRKICRNCWKAFNDGIGCPWTGGLDLGQFPNASALSCDKGYATPNGCLAHGMPEYFGGIVAQPQSVRIKDNSTGTWGFGRAKITSTSVQSESIYDQVVPEIYCDANMPVNGKIAAGRDESDFFDALALIGEGPLTFAAPYTDSKGQKKGHTLDGQFWHRYPNRDFGLREIDGSDPAGAQDYFSVGRVGTDPGPGEATDGASVYLKNYAAGTAFIEIRRADSKGLQLSRPDEHTVVAIVAGGLKGWVWTAQGIRSWETLSDPIWIVVNMVLRARGMRFANAPAAETQFDLDSALAAAAICDASVQKMVGNGTEVQFKFTGVLQEEKPLKDWVTEILMNCMGYYTWANGKFKVGLRVNATVVEAFDETNILFGSIQLKPAKPTYNHLTANFADGEFDYENNSVTVFDEGHTRLIGGATAPLVLKSSMNLAGTASKSQAARLVTMRLREELGGTTYAQWKAARNIAFKTTILALNTEPGQVCSLTHDEMPSGSGKFRVLGWRLNEDYSIDVQGRTVTDEMYDLAAGQTATDVPVSASTLDTTTDNDCTVPPAPAFTVTAPGDGTLVLSLPTWADPANTLTVSGAEWTIRYYDEASTETSLSSGVSDVDTSMSLASATGLVAGDYLQLDRECVKITSIAGAIVGIARGQLGSSAVSHLAAAVVRKLTTLVSKHAFDGTSDSSWTASLPLVDAFVASVQCHALNAFGAGADATNNYLDQGTADAPGLATANPWGNLYLINGA